MPTRKQRRRAAKERRHEYETVWLDSEGNELEDPPEELVGAAPEKRTNGAKPKAKAQPQRGGRPLKVPPPPSWRRALRRSLILGGAIFALFYVLGAKNGGHNVGSAAALAVLYTALFIPFTYFIDRFAHNRWQRRAEQQSGGKPARKR
jgi:hypothetical protein